MRGSDLFSGLSTNALQNCSRGRRTLQVRIDTVEKETAAYGGVTDLFCGSGGVAARFKLADWTGSGTERRTLLSIVAVIAALAKLVHAPLILSVSES